VKIFSLIIFYFFFSYSIGITATAEDVKSNISSGTKGIENTKTDAKSENITTICPPGSKVQVNVGKDSENVKDVNVTTVCKEGSEVEVSVGSADIESNKQVKGDINRKVSNTNVTTIAGKDGKSKVNVGSVKISK
jgi:hypothetical protein